jgi:hypothetical protein
MCVHGWPRVSVLVAIPCWPQREKRLIYYGQLRHAPRALVLRTTKSTSSAPSSPRTGTTQMLRSLPARLGCRSSLPPSTRLSRAEKRSGGFERVSWPRRNEISGPSWRSSGHAVNELAPFRRHSQVPWRQLASAVTGKVHRVPPEPTTGSRALDYMDDAWRSLLC